MFNDDGFYYVTAPKDVAEEVETYLKGVGGYGGRVISHKDGTIVMAIQLSQDTKTYLKLRYPKVELNRILGRVGKGE